jgi:hypothetical protein
VSIACGVVLAALALASNAWAVTTLVVNTAPALPALTSVTLNGQTQTTTTTWTMANNIKITSSGTNSGWNVTVGANTTGGTHSAVFKQYCPNATCGSDAGPGYVAGGFTLPADSLTWKTGAASWTSAAPRPAYQCNVSPWCFIDHAAPTKVVSASTSVALGAWTSSGTSTLSLATPANLRKLLVNEVYRVDAVWTVSSGP